MSEDSSPPTTDNRQPIILFLAVALFLALRITLAAVREPFFDELFTLWIAKKPLAEILTALRHDSGPPLYYILVKNAFAVFGASIATARALSLIAAAFLVTALVTRKWKTGAVSALLLAFFPPHVYLSGEARAYSLCAAFIGVASLGLEGWRQRESRAALVVAVMAMVAAASSHYYGVLYFPVPFLVGVLARQRKAIVEGFIGSLGAGILFIPGFVLASVQPREATAWFAAGSRAADVCLGLGSLQHFGFAAPYPSLFVDPAPLWLQAISLLAVVLAVLRTGRDARAVRFAVMTLVPVALIVAFAAAGRSIYFPVRFEAVFALPFVAWVAFAVQGWEVRMRRALIATVLVAGAISCFVMVQTHARRGPDAFRQAARWTRQRVDPRSTIVASGYAFLEVENQVDDGWRANVVPFPLAQGLHPGWRERAEKGRLEKELEVLRFKRGERFVWIGDARSDEASVIARNTRSRVLYRSGRVVVLAVDARPHRAAPTTLVRQSAEGT